MIDVNRDSFRQRYITSTLSPIKHPRICIKMRISEYLVRRMRSTFGSLFDLTFVMLGEPLVCTYRRPSAPQQYASPAPAKTHKLMDHACRKAIYKVMVNMDLHGPVLGLSKLNKKMP